jgi:predicted MFS family arabinose efflux permease
VRKYFSRIVLMLGNVVTGLSILGPAGMLAELANGLQVGIHDTGLLVTYGATVLCIGSPVMAWLTTRIDRRALLVATLAVLAAGQAASALTSNYGVILLLRIGMLAIGAIYTPQAAATVALIAPGHERPSAIAFVFLGWSIAIAGGLPLVDCNAFRLAGGLRHARRGCRHRRRAVVRGIAERASGTPALAAKLCDRRA